MAKLVTRTGWILARPQPEPTILKRLRWAEGLFNDPRTCHHPSPVYDGHVWFCHTCGEPVRDKEAKRQTDLLI